MLHGFLAGINPKRGENHDGCAYAGDLEKSRFFACVTSKIATFRDLARNPATVMAGAIGVLVLAACIAGLIPARRAASINPVTALRVD